MKGGNGDLSLKQIKNSDFTFFIHTDWANGHMCELEGRIHEGLAVLKGDEDGKPCKVTFLANSDSVKVEDDHEACGSYCGARAGVAGEYLIPPAGCSRKEVQDVRAKFKQLYDQKEYAKAEVLIKPLLSNCQSTIDFVDSAWIRNDLAITQYRLKKLVDCRLTLEPLASDASTYEGSNVDDPNVLPEVIPLFPVMKATLTNLKLCRNKVSK